MMAQSLAHRHGMLALRGSAALISAGPTLQTDGGVQPASACLVPLTRWWPMSPWPWVGPEWTSAQPRNPADRVHRGGHMMGGLMRGLIAISFMAAVLLVPTAAGAGERLVDGALGAAAGALVGGPAGFVAGGLIGYAAGPRISRPLGFHRFHRHYRFHY